MKVLHISSGFPVSYPGGIPNYVRALAKSQVHLGYQVHVLARPEPVPLQDMDNINLHSYTPVDVVSFSLRNYAVDRAENSIVSLIQKEKFDLVHFHMALDLSAGFLERFSALRVPYIVSLHDYYYICPRITMIDVSSRVCREVDIAKCNTCIGKLDQVNVLRRAAKKFKITLPRIRSNSAENRMGLMREFLVNSSLLLSVSRRTAQIYQKAIPDACIAVEQIGSESINGAVEKTPSEKIRVVALSILSRHKGADLLELLLTRIRRSDMEFHFYGRDTEGYGNRLGRLGLKCHGPYKPSDISSIMSKSDIGLVLSIWEDNGPQAAMEFINHKVPVLGTLRGGIPDIVAPDAGYLFEPDRSEDVDEAVRWLQTVTIDEIHATSANIKRLRSPLEHAQRLDAIYKDVVR